MTEASAVNTASAVPTVTRIWRYAAGRSSALTGAGTFSLAPHRVQKSPSAGEVAPQAGQVTLPLILLPHFLQKTESSGLAVPQKGQFIVITLLISYSHQDDNMRFQLCQWWGEVNFIGKIAKNFGRKRVC